MIRKSQGTVEWLEFELLTDQPGLVHGVFLRHGGISPAPFLSLNVSGREDLPENIRSNRKRLQEALSINSLLCTNEVHGCEVTHVKRADQTLGECDGLITDVRDIGLLMTHADCQVAIFYDPIHHALANVHAGWRGNVQNIYRAAVEKMQKIFGSKAADLLVGVSPSLGPMHAEFKNYKIELPESFWSFQVKPLYFDLWAIASHQLEECGILPDHIQIANLCTYENKADFFSYRRDKQTGTGRHGTVAMLKGQ